MIFLSSSIRFPIVNCNIYSIVIKEAVHELMALVAQKVRIMEHRLHKRYPISLQVHLVSLGRVVAIVHADDICSEGVRIQNPGIELSEGEGIAVEFTKTGHPRPISYCASARVIYSNSKTIGLKFDDYIPTRAIINGADLEMSESSMRRIS